MTNPMQIELIPLQLGDDIPIADILANLTFQGIITNPLNPVLFSATMDAFQTQAVLTVPVLQGPPGNPGTTAQTMFFQNVNIIEELQLPTDLGPTVADVGKFWVLPIFDNVTGRMKATTIYVWTGTGYVQLPVGSPGPPGPYPDITPELNLVLPGNGGGPGDTDSWVAVDTIEYGTPADPVETFNLAVPQGVQGPSSPLGAFIDVDFQSVLPVAGDTVVCSSRETPAAPTGLAVTPHSGTGGTLPAAHYYWVVTATVPNGETIASNEANATLAANSSATLTWVIPPNGGATGYNVYRGTAPGAENMLVADIESGTQLSFIDTGTPTVAAAPPTTTAIPAGKPIWVPSNQVLTVPQFYTLPQSAFQNQVGLDFFGGTTIVGEFAMPPQPWPWVAWVFGKLQVSGISISLTPLLVGATVTLGATNGPQIATGYSDGQSTITLVSGTGPILQTPTNGVAVVPANHTGTEGTLFVNIAASNGFIGLFDFNAAGSELSVLVIPIIVPLTPFPMTITASGIAGTETFGTPILSHSGSSKELSLGVPKRTSVRQHRPQTYHRRGMS